jgi:hypothetical protein
MPLRQGAPAGSAAPGTAAPGGSPASRVAGARRPCCQRPGHCAARGQPESRTGESVVNEESASHLRSRHPAATASAGRLRLPWQE